MIFSTGDMKFGRFLIPDQSVFYRSALGSVAFVNLRPIVPGHVLVMPERIVPTMDMLSEDEYLDLWSSVRVVQGVIGKKYDATAFNVAVQDGRAAGQSVPHVHVHILPRKEDDFARNDDIYDELEAWAPREDMKQAPVKLDVPDDTDRVDRTSQAMAEEAAMYREILASKSGN
jgi:bis(5'-adenosyl)-triphosphatase